MSNRKNPAVKRILADVRELQTHPSSRYFAAPLEDNMFEWHFTIRGPADSSFADGIYHGRILLPTDYPFKPPNIVFLTKNGRFEVGTKICLSISAYHEESWQPAWGVRTMLEAIISFMPSEGMGAIGALDWTVEERKKLAQESKNYVCSLCGKASLLLSDPALDTPTTPLDPLELSKQALEAAALADSIAQMTMKAAKAPHSPHVHANHTLSGDFPGAEMSLKASNFATDMDVGPFSVQEGTSNYDMITTSVSAPPLEDSDGVADFLPDLSERMSEFDNNNLDAEDNFDCLGMMETLPRESASGVGSAVSGVGSAVSGVGSVSGVSASEGSPVKSSSTPTTPTTTSTPVDVVASPASSASVDIKLIDVDYTTSTGTDDSPTEENRKVSADYITNTTTNTTTVNNTNNLTSAKTSNAHIDEHDHSTCCGGHSHTHAHTHTNTPTTTTTPSTTPSSTLVDPETEQQRALALQEIEQARAHLVTRLGSVDRALAQAVDRIQQAEERLAQNLEQVPQDNVQLGGVRVVHTDANVDNNVNNRNVVERDAIDEWLTVLLIAIGTSIVLMAWRIVLRYYTLFFF